MMEKELEIGKTYVKNDNLRSGKASFIDLVKIIGAVQQNTFEYEHGYRYFSSNPRFYDALGRAYINLLERYTGSSNWNNRRHRKSFDLNRLAERADLEDGFTEHYSIDLKLCNNSDNYIPVDDSRFRIILGSVYVDRMGFLHLIQKINHRDNDSVSFIAGSTWFDEKGRIRQGFSSKPSMRDLVFQKL